MGLCIAGIVLCRALVLILAVTLASLAGRPMHTVEYVFWYIVQLVLSMLLLVKAMPSDQHHGPHPEQIGMVPVWLLVPWGLYLLVLAILAVKGAHEFRKRPHAFLANAL